LRKLCSDEIREVKMKKNGKNKTKTYFLYCSFVAASLALHYFQDDW
jgi:hypothetical protein